MGFQFFHAQTGSLGAVLQIQNKIETIRRSGGQDRAVVTLKLLGTIARGWFKDAAWEIEELKRQSNREGRHQALDCPKLLCLTSGPMMAISLPLPLCGHTYMYTETGWFMCLVTRTHKVRLSAQLRIIPYLSLL